MVIANLLKAYGFGRLQELVGLKREIEGAGFTLEDVDTYVEAKRKALAMRQKISGLRQRRCPECGKIMMLMPVNTGPGDQTGDESKSVWMCNGCLSAEYSDVPVKEILQDLAKKLLEKTRDEK